MKKKIFLGYFEKIIKNILKKEAFSSKIQIFFLLLLSYQTAKFEYQ
jgi:hypothetical protein